MKTLKAIWHQLKYAIYAVIPMWIILFLLCLLLCTKPKAQTYIHMDVGNTFGKDEWVKLDKTDSAFFKRNHGLLSLGIGNQFSNGFTYGAYIHFWPASTYHDLFFGGRFGFVLNKNEDVEDYTKTEINPFVSASYSLVSTDLKELNGGSIGVGVAIRNLFFKKTYIEASYERGCYSVSVGILVFP